MEPRRPTSLPLARLQIENDEVIPRIADGVKQAPLLVVKQAPATLFGNQGLPPFHLVGLGVESQQRAAPEATFLVVPGKPGGISQLINGGGGKVGRHVENAVVHGRREAVMDLALRRPAGITRIIDHFIDIEEIVEAVLRLVVTNHLDHSARHSLGTRGSIDAAVRPHGKRPASVGILVLGELVPFHLVSAESLAVAGRSAAADTPSPG